MTISEYRESDESDIDKDLVPLRAIKGGSVFSYKDRLYVKVNKSCEETTSVIDITGIKIKGMETISSAALASYENRVKKFTKSHDIMVNQLWCPEDRGRPC